MKEKAEIVLANRELLLKYKYDIQKVMEFSYGVNFPKNKRNKIGIERFEKLLKYLEEGSAKVTIAIFSGSFLGYAWFFQTSLNRIHLNEIAVCEEYQSKGIGKRLIEFIETYAKEQSISEVELFCMENNEQARRFYEKMGYETEKRLLIKDI